jgi:cyclophilin family peptidyl-prolyl cis-trans isomerase
MMAVETSTPRTLPLGGRLGARARWALIVLGVLVVAAVAWLLFREAKQDEARNRWDVYQEVRATHEDRENFFQPGSEITQATLDRYIDKLEAWLAKWESENVDDALAPQTRWRIVKAQGESLLSMQDVVDVAARSKRADRALAHLQAIQDRYPDFPLNWGFAFAPTGFANQTKRLVQWFRDNATWDREWLPKDLPPEPDTVVVFRTDRGDLRLGLYSKLGPDVTARFLKNVQSGAYDGTAFSARFEHDADGQSPAQGVRAGNALTREAKASDKTSMLPTTKSDELEGTLPDETRNRVLHVRGTVTAWHDTADPYDHPQEVVFVTRPARGLNYMHTPIGRLIDEPSLATLDRIYAGKTWREDPLVAHDTGEFNRLVDTFQVPVRIVKALAYKDGALLAGDATSLPTKATADESEKALGTLKADAYRVEPPAPATPPAPAPAPVPAPGAGDKPPAPSDR